MVSSYTLPIHDKNGKYRNSHGHFVIVFKHDDDGFHVQDPAYERSLGCDVVYSDKQMRKMMKNAASITDYTKVAEVEPEPAEEEPAAKSPTPDDPALDNPTLEKPMLENPTQVNPTLEKPTLENATQLNTNRSNTDISSTKESSKDGMKAEAVHTVPSQKAGIEKKTDERIKEDKRIYGEYRNVFLADSDLLRLKEKFPTDYGRRIERLSEYMESSGKTYRNHYLTICQWARRDAEREKDNPGRRRFENYECEEGESY